MESTGYGSSHLPSPALVVFSQAANGLSDALRIQRPFHSQIQDAKDLHHLSLVGSYGAHLLHGFPPHFLHPAVSQANTTGSPFSGGGAFVKPFPSNLPLPSAFAPPKCVGLGLEQGVLFSGNESFRTDSSSPACNSLSPPVKEESLEGQTSDEGDRDRICSPERSPETPGFRPPKTTNGTEPLNLRMDSGHSMYRFPFYNQFKNFHHQQQQAEPSRMASGDAMYNFLFYNSLKNIKRCQAGVGIKKPPIGTPPPNSCPVCGIQLAPSELESHFLTELDRLYKLSNGSDRQRLRANYNAMHQNSAMMQEPDSGWETFQRIRANRQARLKAKTRKRKGDSESELTEQIRNAQCQSCPVCHGRLQRTPEEISQHVEECLRKHGQTREEEDETVDVESYGDETSNTAVDLVTQTNINNNVTKIDSIPSPRHPSDEHVIVSGSNMWERKHRIGVMPMNCGPPLQQPPPPPSQMSVTNVSRATPTSSDQITEYQEQNRDNRAQSCGNDNDEEVIVDNTDEEDCPKKKSKNCDKQNDKNSTEEATSSMEIDSATDSSNHKPIISTPDSYVSTSEPAEPTSRAQVLEELRARIRELEGSPFKVRNSHDEDHYKCYICKESYKSPVISTSCWHVHCNDCWITLSDSKKSCPQCKLITTTNELRKIQV